MRELDQTTETETEQAPQVAPEPKPGAGVRVLKHYLQGGSPDVDVVAHVLTDFPSDHDAMLRVLHQALGNGFVQAVTAKLQEQPADAPATATAPDTAAPTQEAIPDAPPPVVAAEPIAPVESSAAAEAASQVANVSTPIVEPAQVTNVKPDYKKKEWASQREFDALDSQQQRMLDELRPGEGALVWNELSPLRRAGFLNVTAVMKSNGFALDGLSLNPITPGDDSGIQQDRLLFTPGTAMLLHSPLEAAINDRDARGDKGFIEDKPEDNLHPGMGQWGGRQWVTRFSMQVGGGTGGGFVDIDEFGPKVDVVGTLGHGFEVLRNKLKHHKTDPFTVAKGLHKRGDDP